MLTGDPDLAAAGFLTARCARPDKYFQVVDAVFAGRTQIGRDGDRRRWARSASRPA